MSDSALNQIHFPGEFHYRNQTIPAYILDAENNKWCLGVAIISIIAMFYFNFLVRQMVRRELKKGELHLLADLISCFFIFVPVAFFLLNTYLNILTRYSPPPWIISGYWFCALLEIFCHIAIFYIAGYSVSSTILKYWFLVKFISARNFGEQKAKKVLFVSHLLLPLLMSFLNSASNGRIDPLSPVDHCWSHPGWRFYNPDITYSQKLQNFFCANREYDISEFWGENARRNITIILRIICLIVKITYILLITKVPELIMYINMLKHINRYCMFLVKNLIVTVLFHIKLLAFTKINFCFFQI